MIITWLPYASFSFSAQVLNRTHLARSIRNARKVYHHLTGEKTKKSMNKNPTVLMWAPYSYALGLYHDALVAEWIKRDYNQKKFKIYLKPKPPKKGKCWSVPEWLTVKGEEDAVSTTHRAALLLIKPRYYSKYKVGDLSTNDGKAIKWTEKPKMALYFPITASAKRDQVDEDAVNKPFNLKRIIKEHATADRRAAAKTGAKKTSEEPKRRSAPSKQSKSSASAKRQPVAKKGNDKPSTKSNKRTNPVPAK